MARITLIQIAVLLVLLSALEGPLLGAALNAVQVRLPNGWVFPP